MQGGTGLGLALVKHIVSRHRGRLVLRSKPGEGMEAVIILPAVHEKSE
ncbi:MAG TPA: ATP-binding protein [Rhabdaerophilum sp.]|nr:ATP-binding protein [Rhabdaerophilum sp.]